MFNVEVIINPSFYIKMDKSIYQDAMVSSLGWIVQDAETECKLECPVVTGNLQRSHFTEVEEETGRVLNSAEYAPDVIYGTENRTPNDYPQRAVNNLKGSYTSRYIQELDQYGVLG